MTFMPAFRLPIIVADIQQSHTHTKGRKATKPLHTTTSTSSSPKKVSFKESVKVRKTKHVNDYTEEELDLCWFSPDEFASIKRNVVSELKFFNANRHDSSQDKCLRGLEGRLSGTGNRRREQRFLAMDTVLVEQELQLSKGISDPARIAMLYREVAARDVTKARRAGLCDELCVRHQ